MQVCFQGLLIRAYVSQFILIPSLSPPCLAAYLFNFRTKPISPPYQHNKVCCQKWRLLYFFERNGSQNQLMPLCCRQWKASWSGNKHYVTNKHAFAHARTHTHTHSNTNSQHTVYPRSPKTMATAVWHFKSSLVLKGDETKIWKFHQSSSSVTVTSHQVQRRKEKTNWSLLMKSCTHEEIIWH